MRVVMKLSQFRSIVNGLYLSDYIRVVPEKDGIKFMCVSPDKTTAAKAHINVTGLIDYQYDEEKDKPFSMNSESLRRLAKTIKARELKMDYTAEITVKEEFYKVKLTGLRTRVLIDRTVMAEEINEEIFDKIMEAVKDGLHAKVLTRDIKEMFNEITRISKDVIRVMCTGNRIVLEGADEVRKYRTETVLQYLGEAEPGKEEVKFSYGTMKEFVDILVGAGEEAEIWVKTNVPVLAVVPIEGGSITIAVAPLIEGS